MRRTLLCAAEPWGFGPPAKMLAVVRQLSPRPRLVLAATGTSLTYGFLNADLFDDIIELPNPFAILEADVKMDAVLTVMDPWAALVGRRRGIPTFYVDSLFWFWQWHDMQKESIEEESRRWLGFDDRRLEDALRPPVNWHRIVPMAYHWSDSVFVQRNPALGDRLTLFPSDLIVPVGAVIGQVGRSPAEEGTMLVSVSGAVSHLTPANVAQHYCALVERLLSGAGLDPADVMVTGNPDFLDHFADNGWRSQHLSALGMESAISTAWMAAIPAGLTTIFEAAAASTPLIFLPEQHGGHTPNRKLVSEADPEAFGAIMLTEWFGEAPQGPAEAIRWLDDQYQRLLGPRGTDDLGRLTSAFGDAVKVLRDPDGRMDRVDRQRRSVLSVIGDFDGARAIADRIVASIRY